MTAAVQSGALVVAFATNAATQITGHHRVPRSSRTATAIPVGAQTVVTCCATKATRNPIKAAATYAVAITRANPADRATLCRDARAPIEAQHCTLAPAFHCR
jgi:hypothetical protein